MKQCAVLILTLVCSISAETLYVSINGNDSFSGTKAEPLRTVAQAVKIASPGDISKCKTTPNCPGDNDLGWYVDLQNSQKLTAEPTIDKDRVYFPIYEPTTGSNACKTGKAILHAYDSKCGNSLLNITLGTGVLSKVIKQGENLYIGIAGEVDKNLSKSGFSSKDNLITGKSQSKDTGNEVQLEKWIENY